MEKSESSRRRTKPKRKSLNSFPSMCSSDSPVRAALIAAYISAFSFVIGSCIYAAGAAYENHGDLLSAFTGKRAEESYMNYTALNATYVRDIWDARRSAGPCYVISELIEAFAWALALPAIIALGDMIGGLRSCAKISSVCFTIAAISSMINFTFQAGLTSTVDWMLSWDSMSSTQIEEDLNNNKFSAIQSLEISYMVAQSRTIWLFAMDDLLLSVGLFSLSFLVLKTREKALSKCFAFYGIFLSLFAFIGFICEVLRFVNWFEFRIASSAINAFIMGVFFPLWLLLFACQLKGAASEGPTYQTTSKARQATSKTPVDDGDMHDIELHA